MSTNGDSGAAQRFDTEDGLRVLLEESHALPIVDLQLVFRTGSTLDPEGMEGLTRTAWRLARMGTAKLRGPEVEEAISRLGGRMSIEVSTSYVAIHGAVIRRNLDPFIELIASLVRRPAFRAKDLAQVKRETLADLISMRDNDRVLAARTFRRMLFEGHDYGRPVSGTAETVRALQRSDVVDSYDRALVADNMLLGIAGDVTREDVERLVHDHFAGLPRGKRPVQRSKAPRLRRGRRVRVVDKPNRSQTQLFVGTLGTRAGEEHYYPLVVGNAAFGGTFTSRLMQEVREKRGWSYGAYSRLGTDRQRDAWYMWTFPGSDQVVDCIRLELELLENLVEKGLSAKEHRFARTYLANSHCFDVDTAAKRLDPRIDEDLFDLPIGYYEGYEDRVRAVTREQSNDSIRARLSARDLCIVLTATAADVVPELEKLPDVRSVDVVPHTSV